MFSIIQNFNLKVSSEFSWLGHFANHLSNYGIAEMRPDQKQQNSIFQISWPPEME